MTETHGNITARVSRETVQLRHPSSAGVMLSHEEVDAAAAALQEYRDTKGYIAQQRQKVSEMLDEIEKLEATL